MQQTVFSWLRSYPSLASLERESLSGTPGSAGLFTGGSTLLRRRSDITGRETRRRRLRFTLQRHCTGDSGPQWLEDFSRWAEATAPALGEDPLFSCGKGQLIRADAEGISRYSIELTFEFTQEV